MMFPAYGTSVSNEPESDIGVWLPDRLDWSFHRWGRWPFIGYAVALIVGGVLVGREIGFGPSEEVGPGASIFLIVGGLVILACVVDRAMLATLGVALAGGVLGAYAAYWGLDQPAPILYGVTLSHVASLFMAGDAARMLIRIRRSLPPST
jgi:hypothetical protein